MRIVNLVCSARRFICERAVLPPLNITNRIVKNLSSGGAALLFACAIDISGELNLSISSDSTSRVCRVAWKTENQIGAAFGSR